MILPIEKAQPRCSVFGECGGCQYQDLPYAQELELKHKQLWDLLVQAGIAFDQISPVVPSPREYQYRCRVDMKFIRTRDGRFFMGFSPADGKRLLELQSCPIAMSAVSDFLPRLKEEAIAKWTPKYKNANLVVKTGDDGRVFWGGMGRRSLRLKPEDYLWTEIGGKKIYYSLESFFQANLSILPVLMEKIRGLNILDRETVFYDLYGGVGLFGVCFAEDVKKVILVEEGVHSLEVAKYNVEKNGFRNFEILPGRMEDALNLLENVSAQGKPLVMIDPPRQGLSPSVSEAISLCRKIPKLLYLSCHPESLVRDLKIFLAKGWVLKQVMPFDFFPRTRHLETLVLLEPSEVL